MRRNFSPEYITNAAHILGVLSHETRLNIVLMLAQGQATVSEICEYLQLPQPNVSHHLGILRNTGLVCDEREGQFVIYRVNVPLWRAVGDGFFDHLLGGEDEARLQHFRIQRLPT